MFVSLKFLNCKRLSLLTKSKSNVLALEKNTDGLAKLIILLSLLLRTSIKPSLLENQLNKLI